MTKTYRDLFFKLSEKHQTVKEVLSVFKKFMLLSKKGRVNAEDYQQYKDFVSKKIEDAQSFQTDVGRFSEALGGLNKYDETYLNGVGAGSTKITQKHELGCDLESNSSNEGNFSHLELSKIGDNEKEEPFFKGSVTKSKPKDNSMDSFVDNLLEKVPFETIASKELSVGQMWQVIRM